MALLLPSNRCQPHEVLPPKDWKPGAVSAAGTQAAAKNVVYRIIPVMYRELAHWIRVCSPALPASVAGFTARMAAEGVRMAANNKMILIVQ